MKIFKKIMIFIKEMFTSESGVVSSKRVSGFIGWLAFISICIYGTITSKQAPDITDMLAICSTSLLGLDSITTIWKKQNITK